MNIHELYQRQIFELNSKLSPQNNSNILMAEQYSYNNLTKLNSQIQTCVKNW